MSVVEKAKRGIGRLVKMRQDKVYVPVPVPMNVPQALTGKTALITGGSSGIGFAMAKSFLGAGCHVIIAGTNEEKLRRCCDSLEGGIARWLVIDVRDVAAIPGKIEEAVALSETGKIDILVNSAGVVAHSDFMNITEEEYDSIMDINAKGTFFMSQAMARLMIEKHIKGHILNVTSSSALRPAWTPYQMSKWAVRGLTLGMADILLPYGIVVNAIAPGPTATAMLGKETASDIFERSYPSKRYAMPSEIASLATFMVSDAGNMIVGDTFYITGGSGTITLHH